MDIKSGFAKALREVRKARGLTQEDFSAISSRTYLSSLERGLYSPTLDKIDSLATMLDIHPLTLIAMAYENSNSDLDLLGLLRLVQSQSEQIQR
ncbi:helix-turn-helix protein [mine drainage metagenome]|uniref:Helix-turn-helix protein n=1 Tax=mine drainage metagenome TaxID=410659 RepID=A0A1J5QF20_9ZZZZ